MTIPASEKSGMLPPGQGNNSATGSLSVRKWSVERVTLALEGALAGVISLGIVGLHFVYFSHAGALWQDEAENVNLAQYPTVGEMWNKLEFHSFPLLWSLLLRGWTGLGLTSDLALRVTGLLAGLFILAMLWLTSRRFGSKAPIVALVFFGLSGWMIRSGDTVRAYGLGLALALLFIGSVWRYLEVPSRRHYWSAALAGIVAVQTLYQNAFLVLATLVAAMATTLLERQWHRTLRLLTIGLLAMLSLVPYVIPNFGPVARIAAWNWAIQRPLTYQYVVECLFFALGPVAWFWCLCFGAFVCWNLCSPKMTDSRRKRVFFTVALAVVIVAYGIFLKRLGYLCNPWYFLACTGFVAVLGDGLLEEFVQKRTTLRWVRLGLVVCAAFISWQPALDLARLSQTNMDGIAKLVGERAKEHDVIVVTFWEGGIPFERYYRGPNTWHTVPPLDDHRLHRFDLVLKKTEDEKVMDPVCDAVREALRTGNSVFLVALGRCAYFPPAPQSIGSLGIDRARMRWSKQLEGCLQNVESQVFTSKESDRFFEPFSLYHFKSRDKSVQN